MVVAGMTTHKLWYGWFLLLALAACNLAVANPIGQVLAVTATPSLPNVRIVQASPTLQPTVTRIIRDIPTQMTEEATAQANVATPAPYACDVPSPRYHARYQVVANVDYANKLATVAQTIRYYHTEATPLQDLVLNVEANNWDGGFQLGQLRLENSDLPHTLERNRLTVVLPAPLPQGCEVGLQMTFSVTPPRITSGITAFKGYFGYSERQLNLSYWLPSVAVRVGGAWLVHPPQTIGEQIVLEQADWDVSLNVNNASGDLKVAMPGIVVARGQNQYQARLEGGRDFPVSMSESYRVSRASTANGTEVELYTFPDTLRPTPNGTQDAAPHALGVAVRAVERYETLFGKSPFSRLLVVQGDFPDGMEFSGLVYVSTSWFYQWQGGYDNYLTVITVHEMSHQWWYAKVGNDAALAPWLDEALATYSEYLYYEALHPNLKDWWWSFRVGYYNPQGAVDSTVYEFSSPRDYINAVYLRGVQMLHNLRKDIGDDAFFKLLADYVRQGSGVIASPTLFWSLLTPEQLALTQRTRQQFLRQHDVNQEDD
jgi:hypothetical protein